MPLAGNVFHTATPTPDDPLERSPQRRRPRPGALGPRARRCRPHDHLRGPASQPRRQRRRQRLQRRHLRGAARAVDRQLAATSSISTCGRCRGRRRRREPERRRRRDHAAASRPAMRCVVDPRSPGSGISVVEDGSSGRLVLAGEASIADLRRRAAQHRARCAAAEGLREIDLHGRRRARRGRAIPPWSGST